MYLTMAIGMEQLQIGRSVILVVVVPMMQFDVLITKLAQYGFRTIERDYLIEGLGSYPRRPPIPS
jgi:hypothetical protein